MVEGRCDGTDPLSSADGGTLLKRVSEVTDLHQSNQGGLNVSHCSRLWKKFLDSNFSHALCWFAKANNTTVGVISTTAMTVANRLTGGLGNRDGITFGFIFEYSRQHRFVLSRRTQTSQRVLVVNSTQDNLRKRNTHMSFSIVINLSSNNIFFHVWPKHNLRILLINRHVKL